jgi:hypothetical protein
LPLLAWGNVDSFSVVYFEVVCCLFQSRKPSGDQPVCPLLGKAIWTLNPSHLSNGTLAAPVVVLPDLDEDGIQDLVVLAIGETQV